MHAAAGWGVIALLLLLTSAAILQLPLVVVRSALPGVKVSLWMRMLIVVLGAVGLWIAIPILIHALLGRPPH
jgi:hypothetical protein